VERCEVRHGEHQEAAGLEHLPDLAQREVHVLQVLHYPVAHGDVELAIAKGKRLTLDVQPHALERLSGLGCHCREELDPCDPLCTQSASAIDGVLTVPAPDIQESGIRVNIFRKQSLDFRVERLVDPIALRHLP
jgi:hypothetical protein